MSHARDLSQEYSYGSAFTSVRPYGYLRWPAGPIRGDDNILCSTAKRDVQVVIVRIDDRCAPGEIRKNIDGVRTQSELPGLGIVGIGRQRTEANVVAQPRMGRKPDSHCAHGAVIPAHADPLTALRPNAPAHLRRANVPRDSTPHPTPAVRCSGLLGRLSAFPLS